MLKKVFGTQPEILMNFENALTVSATVKNDAATADTDGHKYIKAGTPLGAAKPFYLDPNHVVLTPVTDGTAQAVAMHNINITDGSASDTVIRRGDLVLANMDKDVRGMYTDDVQKALPLITLN